MAGVARGLLAYALIWALFLVTPAARAIVIAQLRRLPEALGGGFWIGLAIGSALVILNAALLLQVGAQTYVGAPTLVTAAFALNLVWVIGVATTEEMILRGVLLARLRRVTGDLAALIITAAIFAVMHVGRADFGVSSIVQHFVDGTLFGWIALVTGDIWASSGVHVGKNLFVSVIFGGSKQLLKPIVVTSPTFTGPAALVHAADLFTYVMMLPIAVLVFRRRSA